MPVPGRVDAAQQFLKHADWVKNPPPVFDGSRIEPRDLTAAEQAVEDAALEVMRRYFACEADFGDDPPAESKAPDPPPVAAPTPTEADQCPL